MDPVRRVHYSAGMVLSAEDLQAEQDYLRSRSYLLNRLLLGYGVVEGFEVTPADGSTVTVSAGVAVDAIGRELVLTQPCEVEAGCDGEGDLVVWWAEEPDGVLPQVGEEQPAFNRWLERPRLGVAPPGEVPPDAPAEALVLARLVLDEGSVGTVDLGPRATWTPARPGSPPDPAAGRT